MPGIVRLVEAAQSSKAPMVRLADRYGLGFLALTILLAGLAWALSQDPVRALSVLVVATPCPLILAVPVAIISGMSRAAGRGVLVKGGGVLESLARVRTVILDKTGTLTIGQAAVTEIKVAGLPLPRRSCGWPPASTRRPAMSSRAPSSRRPARRASRSPRPTG